MTYKEIRQKIKELEEEHDDVSPYDFRCGMIEEELDDLNESSDLYLCSVCTYWDDDDCCVMNLDEKRYECECYVSY